MVYFKELSWRVPEDTRGKSQKEINPGQVQKPKANLKTGEGGGRNKQSWPVLKSCVCSKQEEPGSRPGIKLGTRILVSFFRHFGRITVKKP